MFARYELSVVSLKQNPVFLPFAQNTTVAIMRQPPLVVERP